MFDYIECEAALPDTAPKPPFRLFQTKDTALQRLCTYRITVAGQLVNEDDEWVEFHGDLVFYNGEGDGWWEYRARFTEGALSRIELVEYRAPGLDDGAPPVVPRPICLACGSYSSGGRGFIESPSGEVLAEYDEATGELLGGAWLERPARADQEPSQ